MPARHRAHRAPRRDPGLGRHARRAQAGAGPADGGLRRLPGAHRPPHRPAASTPSRTSASSTTRSSTTSSATTARRPRARVNGTFNENFIFNGADALETPEFVADADRRVRHAHRLQPLRRRLGARDGHARTSGPSRSPRTGAAPATARSCTGPTGIAARGEVRAQFHHVIDVAPTVLEAAGLPEPTVVDGVAAAPDRGRQHGLLASTTPTRPSATTTQYFEMFCNRGIYHQGWTAVTRHSTPWVIGRLAAASTTTSGSSTTPPPTGASRTTWRPRCPRSWPSCRSSGSTEARKYNVLPLDDRRVERFIPELAGRPVLIRGQHPDPVRRHGAAHRGLAAQHQEQVARRHRRGRGARGRRRGRHHRPGWSLRRLVALRARRPAALLLQPPRPATRSTSRATPPSRPAPTRCAWSSPTTAVGSARAAPSTSTSTAPRSVRAASTRRVPMVFSADETADVGRDIGLPGEHRLRR